MLERAGLVSKNRRGREQIVRAEADSLRRADAALDLLEAAWSAQSCQTRSALASNSAVIVIVRASKSFCTSVTGIALLRS